MKVCAGDLTQSDVGARLVYGSVTGLIESIRSLGVGMTQVVVEGREDPCAFFDHDVLVIDRRPSITALLRANDENTFHLLMGALATAPKGGQR